MNYLEIINATLIELNYTPVNSFSDLNKIEHKRLMNIINRLNKEICNLNSNFYFRQKIKKISLFTDRCEYTKNFSGKINKIIGKNGLYNFEGKTLTPSPKTTAVHFWMRSSASEVISDAESFCGISIMRYVTLK